LRCGRVKRSRVRPHRYANQMPAQVEAAIVAVKHEKPHWGARKIYELLLRRLPAHVKVPVRSTIHAIMDRHGLVAKASQSRTRAEGTPLSPGRSALSSPLWLWWMAPSIGLVGNSRNLGEKRGADSFWTDWTIERALRQKSAA